MKIIFMGTPEFAVPSLHILIQNGYNIVAVVTAPDKPAGRGKIMSESAIKQYALKNNIPLLQPTNLKDQKFIDDLKLYNADLQIVVAFRMLPEQVWAMPPKGTINLHGSLLPQYRGAAPLNWAIINGEQETGVTTFLLQHEIDTGNIILQKKINIEVDETAGSLHNKMMHIGASVLLDTVQLLEQENITYTKQSDLIANNKIINHAPKIFKDDTIIDWNNKSNSLYNFVRGLSPYPSAVTNLVIENIKIGVKIFEVESTNIKSTEAPGKIITDGKKFINVATKDFYISIKEMQVAGKNKVKVEDFLRGNKLNAEYYFE
jgi:methionyl-tRNA formyltransferase